MKRYILFDLDGTLTDSREGIFNSVRYSLEKLGLPCPSYETLLRFVVRRCRILICAIVG